MNRALQMAINLKAAKVFWPDDSAECAGEGEQGHSVRVGSDELTRQHEFRIADFGFLD
jgi:hypothetical protein